MFVVTMFGCVRPKPVVTFDPDFNETITHFHTTVVPEKHKDFALHELTRGSLFFNNGDCFHSDTRYASAFDIMNDLASDEHETVGLVLAETSRTFRGEPYERSTVSLYRGICQFNSGNYESALAAFRSSLASDEETRNDDPVYKKDFYISYFLAALSYERLGEHDNAVSMLELSHHNVSEVPDFSNDILKHNFITIIATGDAPFPVQGAFWTKSYASRVSPEQRIEVIVDGSITGDAKEMVDLFKQADSSDLGGADGAAVARGVAKFTANVFLSALVGRDVGIKEHRDLRHWNTLPQKFFIFTINLEPGPHHINFRFYDGDGKHLERYEQVWYEVPVSETAKRIFWVRAIPNLHNRDGMELKPLQKIIAEKRVKLKLDEKK